MNFFDLLLARKLGGGGALPTETATVTPTTSEQTVTPTAGHTLSSVTVNPIPSQYIVPTGTKQITENGTDIDVSQYASADVAVPMPDEYAIGGSVADGTCTGYHFKTGVTRIQPYFFSYNSGITEITIPSTVTKIGQQAFNHCQNLVRVIIPNTVTEIEEECFSQSPNLVSANLPTGLTTDGKTWFNSCSKLQEVTFPQSVKKIPNYCCYQCVSLQHVSFLGDVTNIGSISFANAVICEYYDFRYCTAVPALASYNGFNNIPATCKIIVPDALVSSWKAETNWVTYADNIIGVTDYDNS